MKKWIEKHSAAVRGGVEKSAEDLNAKLIDDRMPPYSVRNGEEPTEDESKGDRDADAMGTNESRS